MMEKSILERDASLLVRLLGEVAVSDGSQQERTVLLMSGLAGLAGADCWVMTVLDLTRPGDRVNPPLFLHGGFSEERLARYLAAQEHPDMAYFNGLFLSQFQTLGQTIAKAREELDPADEFSRSPVFPFWQEADIGPILLAGQSRAENQFDLIALYRKRDDPAFTPREVFLTNLLLTEYPCFQLPEWYGTGSNHQKHLAPRLTTVRTLLLEGLGRKQIAAHLGLSENTVSGYIKEIYRHHQVHNQAGLMHCFRKSG